MPLYSYRCACGFQWDVLKKIADLEIPEVCKCGERAERFLTPPRILTDYPGYSCPITGKWIEGRKAHRENLAKHGCRLLESGEKEDMLRNRRARDAALEADVSQTVEAEIHAMPAVKRDRLAAELENGLDVSITRG